MFIKSHEAMYLKYSLPFKIAVIIFSPNSLQIILLFLFCTENSITTKLIFVCEALKTMTFCGEGYSLIM